MLKTIFFSEEIKIQEFNYVISWNIIYKNQSCIKSIWDSCKEKGKQIWSIILKKHKYKKKFMEFFLREKKGGREGG